MVKMVKHIIKMNKLIDISYSGNKLLFHDIAYPIETSKSGLIEL
jgi:hypothetical protein